MRTRFISAVAIIATLLSSVQPSYALVGMTTAAPASLPLLQKSDLTYVGAFRVPKTATDEAGFAYGGTAPAFNPANHSLFLVGHDWHQRVGEISIPEIKNSTKLGDLATATVLQPFADPTDGNMYKVDENTIKVGGLLVYQNQLINTAYSYYDGDANQSLSHLVTSLELGKKADTKGPYKVGTVGAGFVSGYMAPIPIEWQTDFGGPVFTGQCCISIISRTSYGPALSVFNPADLGVKNPVPATPLVYYPQNHTTLGDTAASIYYNQSGTNIRGVIFPNGSRSVLFFGRHGLGAYCYGPGTDDRSKAGKSTEGGTWCYDPADSSKGGHNYPYNYYVWAYDANDLLAVKNGKKQPWDIKPYTVWSFDLPFADDSARIGGAAYDPATGRIFVSQQYGDGAYPVIHVFTVSGGNTSSVPAPTPNPTPVPAPTPVPQPAPQPTPMPAPSTNTCQGLTGEYFNNKNLTGKKLTRVDPFIHFHWGLGSSDSTIDKDTFSTRWTGFITPKYSETYTFTTYSDDGARLWVNGKLIISDWKNHGPKAAYGKIKLQAGKTYPIRMEYFENTGHAEAELLWSSPSQPKETVPASALATKKDCMK